MVAEIEDQHIESWQQVLPVGKIGVSGEAITMGKEQTYAICAAVTPHANFGAILKHNVKGHAGFRKLEKH